MRASKTLIIASVLSLATGFGIGAMLENRRMDAFCGAVIHGATAGNSVDELRVYQTTIDSIRTGDLAGAEKALRALARGDAEIIVACKKDANCTHFAGFEGNRPPDRLLVRRALEGK
jgi:acetylornithine/succinyldiaminopimelate/putrescine aminotransferase